MYFNVQEFYVGPVVARSTLLSLPVRNENGSFVGVEWSCGVSVHGELALG